MKYKNKKYTFSKKEKKCFYSELKKMAERFKQELKESKAL